MTPPLIAESEGELKSLLMKVKEENEKVGLKLNIQKMKIMASGPIPSWEIDGETVETVSDFIFGGSKVTADGGYSHEIKRCLLLGRKVITNLDSIFNTRDITLLTKVRLISSVQFSPVTQSGPTLCDPMNRSTPGVPLHHQLPEFTQTYVHQVSDAIQPSHPLLSPLHMRWPKYWSFSFSIIPSKEIPGLISFRMD